jgi:hypothetical protein
MQILSNLYLLFYMLCLMLVYRGQNMRFACPYDSVYCVGLLLQNYM